MLCGLSEPVVIRAWLSQWTVRCIRGERGVVQALSMHPGSCASRMSRMMITAVQVDMVQKDGNRASHPWIIRCRSRHLWPIMYEYIACHSPHTNTNRNVSNTFIKVKSKRPRARAPIATPNRLYTVK